MTAPRFLAAVAVCAVAVGLLGPRLLGGPAFVDEVSIVNPSEYDVHVEVSGGGEEGWMSITTATKRSTTAAQAVIDQGATWVFRFSTQGRAGGEVRISRADLRRDGWTVRVPDTVVDGFRRQGVPASP